LLLTLACADFERGDRLPETPSPTATPGADVPVFDSDVHLILIDACSDCHQGGGDAGGSDYLLSGDAEEDYEATLAFAGDSGATSTLLTKARGVGHQGGEILEAGASRYLRILDWLNAGAPFDGDMQ
jgi:hypothetical protein